jgi:hypothetical protein
MTFRGRCRKYAALSHRAARPAGLNAPGIDQKGKAGAEESVPRQIASVAVRQCAMAVPTTNPTARQSGPQAASSKGS